MPMNSLTPHLRRWSVKRSPLVLITLPARSSVRRYVSWSKRMSSASLKLQKLREDIREGLDNGPSTVFDPQEIKRVARQRRLKKSAKKGFQFPISFRATADFVQILPTFGSFSRV